MTNDKLKFIIIATSKESCKLAHELKEKGCDVVISKIGVKAKEEENEEENEEEMENGGEEESSIKEVQIDDLMVSLAKVENKDDYFIFIDNNDLISYSEELEVSGFKNGLFTMEYNDEFDEKKKETIKLIEDNYLNAVVEEPKEIDEETIREQIKKEYEEKFILLQEEYDMKYSKLKALIKDIIYGEEE